MCLATINNFQDELPDNLEEVSVMLDELNEMLGEENIDIPVWIQKILDLIQKGGMAAIDYCKEHKITCKWAAKLGFKKIKEVLEWIKNHG